MHFLVVVLVLAVLVLLLTNASERFDGDGVETAIVGGTLASYFDFPWFASLYFGRDTHWIGGALIAPDVVLTCAHATLPQPGSKVRIGGDDWQEVKDVLVNTRHASSSRLVSATNDIMLVRLRKASRKQPIKLATARPNPNEAVLTIGHGMTTPHTSGTVVTISKSLKKAWLTYVTGQRAGQLIDAEVRENPNAFGSPAVANSVKNTLLHDAVITVVSFGKNSTCNGDSGGPLITYRGGQPQLVGVTSGGPNGCNYNMKKTYFSFFISVPHHLNWIQGRIGSHNYYVQAMNDARCAYAGRGRTGPTTWKCPKKFPWDAGVWDQGPDTPAGYQGKQCARDWWCATYLNHLFMSVGARANPVRNTP